MGELIAGGLLALVSVILGFGLGRAGTGPRE